MRTSAIVRIIIWSFIALALIFIMAGGSILTNILGNLSFQMPFSCASIPGNYYKDSEYYTAGGGSVDAAGIRDIDINWVGGSVRIIETDEVNISFDETSNRELEDQYRLHYYANNNRLIIQFCKSKTAIYKPLGKELVLSIPRGLELDTFTVSGVSADIEATGINAGRVNISSVSGGMQLKGLSGEKFDAETVSGNIKLMSSSFTDIDTESVSGNMIFEPSIPFKTLEMDTVSGNLHLYMSKDMGFIIKHDTVSGSFQCDFPVTMQRKKAIYLDGKADIDISSVSGDIRIEGRDGF